MSCAGMTALTLSMLLAVAQEGIKGTAAILVYTLSSIWRTFLCFVFRTDSAAYCVWQVKTGVCWPLIFQEIQIYSTQLDLFYLA